MKKCPECGKVNKPVAKVCEECGAELSSEKFDFDADQAKLDAAITLPGLSGAPAPQPPKGPAAPKAPGTPQPPKVPGA